MMKLIVLLLVGVALANAFSEEEYQNAFLNWMHEHNRIYSNEEFEQRYLAFKSNMDYVNSWNAQNNETILGLNVFADLTNQEYQNLYLKTPIDYSDSLRAVITHEQPTIPLATVDWRTKGAVTGVKNQGQCGSCWSFGATGAIEGAWFLKHSKLVSLSEQNLVDCSTSYGNHGCNGGLQNNAFRYVIANKGIDTEASYPYTARQGTCRYSAANIGATISSYKSVAKGSEAGLASALNGQVVTVAIDASKQSFQLYKSGVYYDAACSSTRLDHAVLAVGYDTSYYIVKNSWGTGWGSAGYIMMARGRNNNCGIATDASFAVV